MYAIRNPSYTNSLLNSTRVYFGTLGLFMKVPEAQVRIISGSEEGLSGWITTNMLLGQLYPASQPFQTTGVSDMGGTLCLTIMLCLNILFFLFKVLVHN